MADHQDAAFIEYVVKQLVEKPEAVELNRSVDELGVLIQLTVDPSDMGRVIGKEGRTAKALRTLLRVLGAKNNAKVNLKIVEPGGHEVGADRGQSDEAAPRDHSEIAMDEVKDDEQPMSVTDVGTSTMEKIEEAPVASDTDSRNDDQATEVL